MGVIIQFPDQGLRRASGKADVALRGVLATVLILPAIRIERHTEETTGGSGPEEGAASGRRRRRRARS